MKERKLIKRVISFILVITLIIPTMPVGVLADELSRENDLAEELDIIETTELDSSNRLNSKGGNNFTDSDALLKRENYLEENDDTLNREGLNEDITGELVDKNLLEITDKKDQESDVIDRFSNLNNEEKLYDEFKEITLEEDELESSKTEKNYNLRRDYIEEWLDEKINQISSLYSENAINGDWVIAELGKLDIKINEKSIDKQIEKVFDKEGNYKGENANELLKIILALRASGIDPENIYGVNLVEELITNKETRGFYYDSCGLWAINSDDYKIVEKYQDRIDSMVKRLLDAMEPGYVTNGFSKFDDTGFALLALAPYYHGEASGKYNGSKEVKRVVDNTLNYISENQMGDGDFSNGGAWGAPNSNTLSMVLLGVSAIDPELVWDMKYVESGNTMLSLLKEKYDINNGFKWQENDKKINPMSTEQGLRALINYKSMIEGKGLVFDYRGKEKVAIEKENEEDSPFKVTENKDGELVIVGYESTDVPVNLVIPEKINGKPVKHIGNEVFSYSDYVSPPSRTKNPIESVVLPEGLLTIGTRAFSNSNLKEVIIPSTVTEIKDRAFYGNEYLSKVEFEENSALKIIGAYAFSAPYNSKEYIKSISLPEKLEEIGEKAFDGQKIRELKLPETLKDLGSAAFGNNLIEEVIIPAGIESLGLTEPNRSGNRKETFGAFWKNTNKNGEPIYTKVYDLSGRANNFNVLGIVNPSRVKIRYVDENGKEIKDSIEVVGIELKKPTDKGKFIEGSEKLLTNYILPTNNYKFFNNKEEMETLSANYFIVGKEYLFKAPDIIGYKKDSDKTILLDDEYKEVVFEYKKIKDNLDRNRLNELLKFIEEIDKEEYTNETLVELKKALNLKEKDQEAINFKVKAIEEALKNLKPLTDKTELKKEITRAEKLVDELSKMKEEGQKEFKEALVEAKLILDSESALQKEVEDATKILLDKRSKLSRKPITVKIRIETNDRTIFEENEITFDHEKVEPLFEKAGYDKLERSTYYRPLEAILLAVDKAGIDVSNPDEFDGGPNGSFITKIGKLEMNSLNAGMDGWMYWVNNDYANLGIRDFEINDNDTIDLFFKEDYMKTKYSYFTETKKEVEVGEEFELELKFNHFNEVDAVDGAKILIDDVETDYVTDESGKVKIKIDKAGSYHISAEKKNEDGLRVITRPYARVDVKESDKPQLEINREELDLALEEAKEYSREVYGENVNKLEECLNLAEANQEEIDIKVKELKKEIKVLKEHKHFVENVASRKLNIYENINLNLYTEETSLNFKDKLKATLKDIGENRENIFKIPTKDLRNSIETLDNLFLNLVRRDLITLDVTRNDRFIELDIKNLSDINLKDLNIYIGQYSIDDNRMLNLRKLTKEILAKDNFVEQVDLEIIKDTVIKVFIWDYLGNSYIDAVELLEDVKEDRVSATDYADRVNESIRKTARVAIGNHHSMDWVALGLGTSGNKNMIPGDYLDNVIAYLDENNGEFKNKPTEYERMAIGVLSAGGNPRKIGNYDLIEKIYNARDLDKQGINAMAFGLIALDLRDYEIPEDAIWNRGKIIDWILEDECSNEGTSYNKPGGWAWGPMDKADVDMTAMVLTSLAPYNNEKYPEVQEAIKRGFDWLKYAQEDDGQFASWGNKNSESAAQVIMAAAANGIDPAKEFDKNGTNVIDALFYYEVDTGGFAHMDLGEDLIVNGMATEQALYALSQLKSFIEGKGSIYKFSPEIKYSVKGLENGEVINKDVKEIEVISDATVKVLLNSVEVIGDKKYKLNLKEGINELEVIIGEGTMDEVVERYKIYYEKDYIFLDVKNKLVGDKQLLNLQLKNLEDMDLKLEIFVGQYDKHTNKMKNIIFKDLSLAKEELLTEEIEVEVLDNTFIKVFVFDLDGNPYTDVITIK